MNSWRVVINQVLVEAKFSRPQVRNRFVGLYFMMWNIQRTASNGVFVCVDKISVSLIHKDGILSSIYWYSCQFFQVIS